MLKKDDKKKKQFYRTTTKFLIANRLETWDIQKAALTVLHNKGIIQDELFKRLDKKEKLDRNRYVGKFLGHHFVMINDVINIVVNKFITKNNIQERNIVSKDRDSITIANVPESLININKFELDGYTFVKKETYTSYIIVNNYIFFFNFQTKDITVKGLSRVLLDTSPLKSLMVQLFTKYEQFYLGIIEYNELVRFVYDCRNKYVNGEYPSEMYKELNGFNKYKVKNSNGKTLIVDSLPKKGSSNKLDCGFNYHTCIKPFIQILSICSPRMEK